MLYSYSEKKIVDDFVFSGDVMAFDTETTGLDWLKDKPFMLSFADKDRNAYALDLRGERAGKIYKKVEALLQDPKIVKKGWNIKFDVKMMRRISDVKINNIQDLYVLMKVVNNNLKSFKLKEVAKNVLGLDIEEKETLDKYKPTESPNLFGGGGYDEIPFEVIAPYAAKDALLVLDMDDYINKAIEKEPLLKEIAALENALLPAILDIEMLGFKIDAPFLNAYSEKLMPEMAAAKKKLFDAVGEFDIMSDDQLGDVLFNKLKLVAKNYTATGKPKVDKWTLKDIKHPIVEHIKAYKENFYLKNTFIDGLLKRQVADIIYAEINQAAATTGRMSCSNPNLQNLPKNEIRKAFIARAGFSILKIDYSQIEYRIFIHYLNNPEMIEAYKNGVDMHKKTAQLMFNKKEITKEERQQGKQLNFGLIYGMGASSLAQSLNITQDKAYSFLNNYFAAIPEIKSLRWRIKDVIEKRGYIRTIFNRFLRHLDSRTSYKGLNALVSGSAADMFKKAVIEVNDFLKDKKSNILNLVHDEIVMELHDSEKALIPKIKAIMEGVVKLRVPIVCDAEIGKNWKDTENV